MVPSKSLLRSLFPTETGVVLVSVGSDFYRVSLRDFSVSSDNFISVRWTSLPNTIKMGIYNALVTNNYKFI